MSPSLENIVEAVIFAAEQPIAVPQLLGILNDKPEGDEEATEPVKEKELGEVLAVLTEKYGDERFPFEIRHIAEGYQFFTKRSYYPWVKRGLIQKNSRKLTKASLETLSIIAYRQPITRAEMEFIRGVNCDYSVQKLLDKQLISIVGRAEAPGRPLLYASSPFFMQYFGLSDMADLPKLKEFEELVEDQMEMFRQHQESQNDEGTEAKPFEGQQDPETQGAGEEQPEGEQVPETQGAGEEQPEGEQVPEPEGAGEEQATGGQQEREAAMESEAGAKSHQQGDSELPEA